MTLMEAQQLIERMYSAKDRKRGAAGTFLWLMEEVGELAAAIGEGQPHHEKETLANVEGVDLTRAMEKYRNGCPGCGEMVCRCDEKK
jgi:NTP pyrophosphatase (non-canonical NTP hydrolase)